MRYITPFIKFLLLLIVFSGISPLIKAQEKRLEFNLGFAPPLDAIHVGTNFRINRKLDVGLSIGTIPDSGFDFNNQVNIGFETKYKFGESKRIKEKVVMGDRIRSVRAKTWYAGLRLNQVSNTRTLDTEKKSFYIIPSIGRHCNFNRSMGLNIDFGLAFTAQQTTTYTGNDICRICFEEENPQYPLLPSLRIQFFIKI